VLSEPPVGADTDWWSDPELLRSGELGLYDFEHFVYYLAAQDDREAVDITAAHEYLHHQLADGTNYGLLIAQARQELKTSGDERDRRLFRALVREAVVVNEMVATYASVTEVRPSAAVELPSAYRLVYDRCARLVEHSFETELLRTAYSTALGALLMMVRPSSAELESIRAGELTRVPASSSPDKCLDVAERHLLSLPRHALRDALREAVAFYSRLAGTADSDDILAADTEEALIERAGNVSLHAMLHRVLGEKILDEVLPGFEDAGSDFRLERMARLFPEHGRVREPEVVETARKMTQQRVALWQRSPGPAPVVAPVGGLAAVDASGVDSSWTHGVYCYAQRPEAETEILLLSLQRLSDPPSITYLVLGEAESAALLHWPGPLVVIADQTLFSFLEEADGSAGVRGLVERGCFVHVSDNPVDFALQCLDKGRAVAWFYGGVGYETDAIDAEHGLEIVVYAVEGIRVRFFHFSNSMMSAGLKLFTDYGVADTAKVTMVTPDQAQEITPIPLLSALLDHPLVLTHVRAGQSLPSDVRQLSGWSQRA
jgi:hypothetical protein